MPYFPQLDDQLRTLKEWFDLAHEQGADARPLVREFEKTIAEYAKRAQDLDVDPELAREEPDDLNAIRALRPDGPRTLPMDLDRDGLFDRIKGAWMGRAAGCMLGAPCEGFNRRDIRFACAGLGIPYPLSDYWPIDPKPAESQIECNGLPRRFLLRPHLHCIMPDDDLTYTLLGLLVLEEYGLDFTSENVGEAWLKYLPYACTAEKVALENLKNGLKPPETANVNNPDSEWLGADIRSDPWGYAAPGMPELAAEFAWRDSSLSHVRNGIYGAMYFSAVISAALATGDMRKSIELGLTEIPENCRLAKGIRKTLEWVDINDSHNNTLDRIFEEYRGMHVGHTINCACLTVAGVLWGRNDFENIITLTVMGGLDTDCTGATAGSIAGAALGYRNLPEKWMKPLGTYARTYLNGIDTFGTDDVVERFTKLAMQNRKPR